MNHRIRVIKQGDQRTKEPEVDRLEQANRHNTREITGTIKLWISEFKERRRIEEHRARTAHQLILTALQ